MHDPIQTLALTLGSSWASGINLYATVLVLGVLGATGAVDLPPGLEVLSHPAVLLAAGTMYIVEFFADKVPGVDSTWDGLHTFIRIPAGALIAAGAVGDSGPALEMAAALLGGGIAAASHATKAGTRVMINTSPEPFTNWTASVTEDIGVVGGLLLAVTHPVVFLVLLALFFVLMIWLLPKLWRGIKRVFGALGRVFSRSGGQVEEGPDSPGTQAALTHEPGSPSVPDREGARPAEPVRRPGPVDD